MVPVKVKTAWDKIVEDAEIVGEQRAFVLPHLRPYLGDKRTLRTLGAGLAVLTRRLLRVLRKGMRAAIGKPAAAKGKAGALDTLEMIGTGVLVLIIGATTVASAAATAGPRLLPYLPIITGIAVPALLVAAWVAAPPMAAPVPAGRGDTAVAHPPEDQHSLDAATIARLVRQIAVANSWQGVQLDDLLAHLPGRSKADLVAALSEARIPVEEQLKIRLPGGRQRNRKGVRVSALPEGLGEAPATPAETPLPAPVEHHAEGPPTPLPNRFTVHPQGPG